MQRVEYAALPGVREDGYIPTINKIFGHIKRSQLSAREMRDWLKEEGLYNKDETPGVLTLLDIHSDGVARLGPWAEKFFAAADDEAAKDLLYRRLVDENTLLVKYVLEALDTEGGGRLHSTHEMNRMLTSYVYPGKPVNLVPFQNWIKWIVASGRVKLIGIRWGLTDLGKQAVPRLRSIDADEFLEDEKADAESGAGAVVAPAPVHVAAAPVAPPAPVAAVAAKASGKASESKKKTDADPDTEEFLDMPPEAEPVDDSVFERYEQELQHPDEAAAAKAAAEPPRSSPSGRRGPSAKPTVSAAISPAIAHPAPVTLPRHSTVGTSPSRQAALDHGCNQAPMDVGQVIASLRDYGRTNALGGGSLLLAHGLEARMAQNDAPRHLFLAALLARLYAARADGQLVEILVEKVGGLLPIAILLDRPEALTDVLVRWGLATADPAISQIRSCLLDAVLGGRALKAQADLPTVLAEAPTAETLIGHLQSGLLRASSTTAQLWLVREMVRAGLWTRVSASEIAFVPTRAARLLAYRLRLIDSHFVQGSVMLLQIARRLAPILPPTSVEAAAFEVLAPHDHLRFDCTRVPICQQPCALIVEEV